MDAILFFDTETTGKWNKYAALTHASQPRMVQLGLHVCTPQQETLLEFQTLIKPDGWTVPEEAASIHGITTERCEKYGIPIIAAVGLFSRALVIADLVVAHNYEFDELIVSSEMTKTLNRNPLMDVKSFCTMKATTDICKLPGKYGYKWPKLDEAYRHFFHKGVEGAHDAMVDVRACRDIYFALLKLQSLPATV